MCRSREGAWIEILLTEKEGYKMKSRSREGAWIEIDNGVGAGVTNSVAPARERGLKYYISVIFGITYNTSLPRGSVD